MSAGHLFGEVSIETPFAHFLIGFKHSYFLNDRSCFIRLLKDAYKKLATSSINQQTSASEDVEKGEPFSTVGGNAD